MRRLVAIAGGYVCEAFSSYWVFADSKAAAQESRAPDSDADTNVSYRARESPVIASGLTATGDRSSKRKNFGDAGAWSFRIHQLWTGLPQDLVAFGGRGPRSGQRAYLHATCS